MTNKRFWLGMLVLVLVFGMVVIGCDELFGNGSIIQTDDHCPQGRKCSSTLTNSHYSVYSCGRKSCAVENDVLQSCSCP